jgi:poly-beta-1,6-N-acetyl-D-glucosamine biosynthesis protein PgaD
LSATTAWPPLILARRVPRWVRVRDLALTIGAWAVLAYWVRGALLLAYDWLSHPIFELSAHPAPQWSRMWLTLAPFLAASALLAAWLVFWAARRSAELAVQRSVTQPPPLEPGTHAAGFGLQPAGLLSLREARVQTVRFDAHGAITPPES